MTVKIIPAAMAEFPQCAEIAERAWEKGYKEYEKILGTELFINIFPEWQKAKAESMEPYFKGDADKRAFIAVEGGQTAGFITCELDFEKKIGELCNNAVDPNYQGRGIGSMMHEYILKLFKKEGMTAAFVHTMDEDAYLPARRAYEKVGFEKRLNRITYYMKL